MGKKQILRELPEGDYEDVTPKKKILKELPEGDYETTIQPVKAPLIDEWKATNLDEANQLENTLDDIVKTSRRSISDGERDILRNMLKDPNLTGEQAKESIQAMQGYHPKQEQSVYGIDPAYYVKAEKNGIMRPIPLAQGERPPKEYQVENVWGQTKAQAQDDSWYTDLTKSLFNALPSLAMGAADIGNFASLAVTGEESELMNRAKNTAESLKMFKDDNGGRTLYNPEGVKDLGDLVASERFDLSRESLWNTVNWAAESLPQFLLGAGIAGRGVQGAKALVGMGSELGAAGKMGSVFAASTAMQLGENMEAAKEAGLKGREIAQYAGPVTAIQAGLDAFTGLDIGATLFNRGFKTASKNLSRDFAKQLSGLAKEADGTLAPEAMKTVSKMFAAEYGQLAKEYAKTAAKDLGGEMLQESLQDVTTKAGQQIWDNMSSEDKAKFGTDALSAKSFASYLANGINSLGVAPVTVITAKQKYNQQSTNAYKIVQGGKAKVDEFKANIYQSAREGKITEQERDNAINKIDKYQIYSDQTKDLPNLTEQEKKKAFELSFNIDSINSEISKFTPEDIEKLDPIAKAKIDSKKTIAKDLQKDLNRLLLKQDIQTETRAGDDSIKKVAKDLEPETPPMRLSQLLKKLKPETATETKVEPVMSTEVDFEVNDNRSMARIPISQFTTLGFNTMSTNNPLRAKAVMDEHLKTTPNNEMDVVLTEAQNGRVTIDVGNNKQVWLGQSVDKKDGETPNYTNRENFPATKVRFGDRGGDTNMENEEAPMHYYKEPVVIKRVEFKGEDRRGKTIVKSVLPIYNKETGKFISFAKETKFGNSYYPTKEEQDALTRIREANWLTDDLKDFAYIPKEQREANEVKVVDYTKLAKNAETEKELDAILDQADKAGAEIDIDVVAKRRESLKPKIKENVTKPELTLESLPDKVLDTNVFTTVENEETGEQEKVSVKAKKLQAEIKKKFKLLEKLNDCIHG